jgi:Holliday junction resolvase-like predicted endonuclease
VNFNEATIRDSLATNIEILEPGLKLEKKEKFIPNHYGTRGFIDLVAYDREGRIVLIEVKKTNQASREAPHEVLKYIEGVKQHLRLREDEIRVFVASPTWNELLVPFSSLVNRTTCQVEGFNLELSPSGEVTGSEIITPLDLRGDRLIAPWHELRYYMDEIDCRKAIAEY